VANQGFVAEPRSAEGRIESLPELAAALVRLKVDVLVAMGTPATIAAKHSIHEGARSPADATVLAGGGALMVLRLILAILAIGAVVLGGNDLAYAQTPEYRTFQPHGAGP